MWLDDLMEGIGVYYTGYGNRIEGEWRIGKEHGKISKYYSK